MNHHIRRMSISTFIRNLILITTVVISSQVSYAQTIILTHDNNNVVSPSSTLLLGSTRTFESSSSCDTVIKLMYFSDPNSILVPDTVIDFTTTPFNYTFDRLGRYYFFCSMNSTTQMSTIPSKAPAEQSFLVVSTLRHDIPALGEWGLIILFLLFLIVSIVAMRSVQTVSYGGK